MRGVETICRCIFLYMVDSITYEYCRMSDNTKVFDPSMVYIENVCVVSDAVTRVGFDREYKLYDASALFNCICWHVLVGAILLMVVME